MLKKLLLLLLLPLITLSACKKEAEVVEEVARPVKTLLLTSNNGQGEISYPGKVGAQDAVDLAFEVSGKLIEFPIRRGQKVDKGDLIARLDPRDFENNAASNKATYLQTKADLERYRNLYADNAISVQELQIKQRENEVALANFKIAKKALDDTQLRAPFKGSIAKQYVENFQNIQAKEAIASLQDVSELEIIIDVPENDIGKSPRLRSIMRISQTDLSGALNNEEITSTAVFKSLSDKTYSISLKEFETEADPVTQTFRFKFNLKAPEEINILPGMTATVKIEFKEKEGAHSAHSAEFVIPSNAVFSG